MEKNWREAKPKWAVEAAEKEIAAMKRRLALRWPDEARPTPVEFRWGSYDLLDGQPIAGEYFYVSREMMIVPVHIRQRPANEPGYNAWQFSSDGEKWSTNVVRGPLYTTQREAKLAALWSACDEAAEKLEKVWEIYIADRGFV